MKSKVFSRIGKSLENLSSTNAISKIAMQFILPFFKNSSFKFIKPRTRYKTLSLREWLNCTTQYMSLIASGRNVRKNSTCQKKFSQWFLASSKIVVGPKYHNIKPAYLGMVRAMNKLVLAFCSEWLIDQFGSNVLVENGTTPRVCQFI